MAIVLSDNIQNNAPKPTDSRYLCNQVPYTSVSQANTVILGGTGGVRYTGLTVNISGEEYWYKNGIGDGDLIPKVLGGEGNGTVTGATNGLSTILSGTTVVLGGVLINSSTQISHKSTGSVLTFGAGNIANLYGGTVEIERSTGFTNNNCVWIGAGIGSGSGNVSGILVQPSAMTICSLSGAFQGIKYCTDYGANYTCLSIPHVGWMSGYTQSAVTQNLNTVNVCNVTTTYSATTTNDFIGVSGATLVYLPQSPKPCQRISIADIKGDALANNITICSEGLVINGNPTATINTDYGSITFINNGYSWSAVAFIN